MVINYKRNGLDGSHGHMPLPSAILRPRIDLIMGDLSPVVSIASIWNTDVRRYVWNGDEYNLPADHGILESILSSLAGPGREPTTQPAVRK